MTWSTFISSRKLAALESSHECCLPGNLKTEELKPDKRDFIHLAESETKVLEALCDETASHLRQYILENKEQLVAECPKNFFKKSTNGIAECGDERFPADPASLEDPATKEAVEAYQSRFGKPAWKALFVEVMQYVPILWYVVLPATVLSLAPLKSSNKYNTKEMRKYLRGIFRLTSFKENSPLSCVSDEDKHKVVAGLTNSLSEMMKEVLERSHPQAQIQSQEGKRHCDAS